MIRGVASLFLIFWATTGIALPDRVLLIGVTDYAPSVNEIAQPLKGPGNDVALMADVLKSKGVAPAAFDILTDEPQKLPDRMQAGARLPERRQILEALDGLVDGARPGTRIFIFFAGHGAQVAAEMDKDEPDGLDEVFLPKDFAIGTDGAYRNAIADHDIGARIDQMVARGAHVWLIADTCHSGSLRRSDGTGAVARRVDLSPRGGGLPDSEDAIDLFPANRSASGSFVGFYAAAVGSLAFEFQPRNVDQTHGALTWTLAHALRDADATTYRALAAEVTAGLFRVERGRARPGFNGALAARHMLSDAQPDGDGFAVSVTEDLQIAAGQLDGLGSGAVVELSTESGAALFRAEVKSAGLTQSVADLPQGPTPELDAVLRAEGLDPEQFRLRWLADRAPRLRASVVARTLDLTLRVGFASPPLRSAFADQVDDLFPLATLVEERPDIVLESDGARVYARPSALGAAASLSVARSGSDADLTPLIRRIAKARALFVVAETLSDSAISRDLDVSVSITPGHARDQGCGSDNVPGARSFAAVALPAQVNHCDEIAVTLTNLGTDAVDISPFYVAADQQIYFLNGYPRSERGGWRIAPSETSVLSYTEATRTADGPLATGPMHLLFLAVKAEEVGDPIDFRHLQDVHPPAQQRSASASPIGQLLDVAGFGLALKRSIGQHETIESGSIVIPLETVAGDRDKDRAK